MKGALFFFVAVTLMAVIQAQTMINYGVPCSDKKIIVDYHNEVRKQVAAGQLSGQPKAANMQKIVWDDALETLAQGWANKMVFQHNPNRKDPRFAVGENIYMWSSTVSNNAFEWKAGVQAWFDEHKVYKYGPIVNSPSTGHYTQVMWANTLYVGCGAAHFKGTNGYRSKLYVCNYGPAGNYLGQYPYTTGAGCESLCCKDQCGKLYGNKC